MKQYKKKDANLIADYLENKISEFISAINYWGSEANKTDNSKLRQLECETNIKNFQTVLTELDSMKINIIHQSIKP